MISESEKISEEVQQDLDMVFQEAEKEFAKGQNVLALQLYSKALNELEKSTQNQQVDKQKYVIFCARYGLALYTQAEFDEALMKLEVALATAKEVYGEDNIETIRITRMTGE